MPKGRLWRVPENSEGSPDEAEGDKKPEETGGISRRDFVKGLGTAAMAGAGIGAYAEKILKDRADESAVAAKIVKEKLTDEERKIIKRFNTFLMAIEDGSESDFEYAKSLVNYYNNELKALVERRAKLGEDLVNESLSEKAKGVAANELIFNRDRVAFVTKQAKDLLKAMGAYSEDEGPMKTIPSVPAAPKEQKPDFGKPDVYA